MVWDVEKGAPDSIQKKPWQSCTCIGGWHYDRGIYERDEYKSAKTVMQLLVDIVSKNGNMLLNIPIRGDGFIDLVQSGWDFRSNYNAVLINNQKGTLQTRSLDTEGKSSPACGIADLDNDQDVDICLLSKIENETYSSVWVNDGKGQFMKQETGLIVARSKGCLSYADVNADGLLDILVGDDHGYTLHLNDTKGNFILTQKFLGIKPGNVAYGAAFGDWDNDGDFDLVISGEKDQKGHTALYLNNGNGKYFENDQDFPGVCKGSVVMADFDNDCKLDLLINGNNTSGYQDYETDRRIALIVKNRTEKPNTPPSPPQNLKAHKAGNKVTLSWEAGRDKESAKELLSYNYYIKNTNTGKYLTAPLANIESGFRQVSNFGNTWMNQSWTLYDLPTGTYEWSVQAIDTGFKGSPFTTSKTFTIN